MKKTRDPIHITPLDQQRLEGLTITISRTVNGQADYLQILSQDGFGLNIVLIANQIRVEDQR